MPDAAQPVADFQDRMLGCVECGKKFIWTAGEQSYYLKKKLKTPHRCSQCLTKKRVREGRFV